MSEIQFNKEDEQLLDAITAAIQKETTGKFAMVPDRINQLSAAYIAARKVVSGRNVKVSYGINEPYMGMGFVSIEGKEIEIGVPALIAKALECADNIDVYPKTTGVVHIDLTFHGLARKIGEEE